MKLQTTFRLLILFAVLSIYSSTNAQLVVLSGIEGGSYEQFAKDIKSISTKPLTIKTSNGSVDNFRQLMVGKKVDITFLQEDVLFHQQANDLENGTNYIEDIRILLPLGYEEMHLIARSDDQSINSLKDLSGKKVAIGDETQGTSITATLIKQKTKLKWEDVRKTLVLDDVVQDLLAKQIDAFFFVGAAPVNKLNNYKGIKLVPVNDERLKEIYYKKQISPADYDFMNKSITTYAVKSVLATNVNNETEEHKRAIQFLLSDIKHKLPELQENGHQKWKEVELNISNIDWEPYPSAEEIFHPDSELGAEITLLSGIHGGSYNEFAKDIQKIATQPIKIRTSSGSADNLNQLMDRSEIFITFLQFDVLFQQKKKEDEVGADFTSDIRVLLPLSEEEIHLAVRKDSKIRSMRKLKGKKVAIGTSNQGTFVTASLVKDITNGKWVDVYLPFDSAYTALLDKEIDGFFFVGTSPVTKFEEMGESANIKLIPIRSFRLKKVYSKRTIPDSTYSWMEDDVKTFAVKSILATNIKGETIAQSYNITKLLTSIEKNIDVLRSSGHPKWREVSFNLDEVNWKPYQGAVEVFGNKKTTKEPEK